MSGAGGSNPASGPCNYCKDPNHKRKDCPDLPCSHCKVTGHKRKDCPDLPCSHCKGTGHTAGVCTTPPGRVCFVCGATGHYSNACPNPVPGPRCSSCGGFGHLATGNPICATVPQIPLCIPCNQHHRPRECQRADRPIQYSEWDGSADVCTQCGQKGHIFRNCAKKW